MTPATAGECPAGAPAQSPPGSPVRTPHTSANARGRPHTRSAQSEALKGFRVSGNDSAVYVRECACVCVSVCATLHTDLHMHSLHGGAKGQTRGTVECYHDGFRGDVLMGPPPVMEILSGGERRQAGIHGRGIHGDVCVAALYPTPSTLYCAAQQRNKEPLRSTHDTTHTHSLTHTHTHTRLDCAEHLRHNLSHTVLHTIQAQGTGRVSQATNKPKSKVQPY
jgi:hypothetical protein